MTAPSVPAEPDAGPSNDAAPASEGVTAIEGESTGQVPKLNPAAGMDAAVNCLGADASSGEGRVVSCHEADAGP